MSKSSRKYQKNKRSGSRWVQTKRSPKNEYKWKKRINYAVRLLNRDKYFRLKSV